MQSTIIGGDSNMLSRSRLSRLFLIAFLLSALAGLFAHSTFAQAMTADQIIEKNIAARGGLKTWRDVQTMTMTGKMDAGTKQNVQLPFVMKLKRPRMSRIELAFAGKNAVQVYDGNAGWKVRPFMGRNEVEPYSPAELKTSEEEAELDGYLIDHEAKGIKVELMGRDSVEGRDAYKLQLTLNSGQVKHIWVDTQSFLEVKLEGSPRKLDGKMHSVEIYYRNYTSINGLNIPFVLETVVEKVQPSRKIIIDRVVLNPKLEENDFARPQTWSLNPAMSAERSAIPLQTKAGEAK
jgi:hypothetical protein